MFSLAALYFIVCTILFVSKESHGRICSRAAWNSNYTLIAEPTQPPIESFGSPHDLFINGNTMWVTDLGYRYIWKFTVGNPKGSIVANTAPYTPLAVYVDSSGTIFSCEERYGTNPPKIARLQMYVGGNTVGTTLIGGPTCGRNLTDLCWCTAGSVSGDQAGNVYVSDSPNNRVLQYNKHSGAITIALGVTGATSTGSAFLSWPRELYVDKNNTLFIFDINNNRVQRRTATGVVTTSVSFLTFGIRFWIPALTFDPDGSIYFGANQFSTSYALRLMPNAYLYTTTHNLMNAFPYPIALIFSMRIDETTGSMYVSFYRGIAKFDLALNPC